MSESDYRKHVAKNARRVLNIGSTYTLDELRARFKSLARKHHPDKGGRAEDFEYLQECFKFLHRELMLAQDRPFNERRAEARADPRTSEPAPPPPIRPSDEGFSAKFNEFYNQNRLRDDVFEAGHAEFINQKDVDVDNGERYAMQRYRPPSPMMLRGQLNFVELGDDNTNDFSERPSNRQGLVYSDYRVAHSTNKLVDESRTRVREEYKNVDELEARRSAETFGVSEEEERMYAEELRRAEADESERQRRMRVRDENAFKHFESVNNRISGSAIRAL